MLATMHPEVAGQLPLGQYRWAFSVPSERSTRRRIAELRYLEACGLRRSWRRHARRVLRDSYALGSFSTPGRVPRACRARVAGVGRDSSDGSGRDESLEVPPGAGSVELDVRWTARAGRVIALDPSKVGMVRRDRESCSSSESLLALPASRQLSRMPAMRPTRFHDLRRACPMPTRVIDIETTQHAVPQTSIRQ